MEGCYKSPFYLPKKEEGLGVKNLEVWNRATTFNLWTICNPANSIWSLWISSYLLRGRSIWEVPCSRNCSWS